MKMCPDCAESVQDNARKCRFCGYRFEAAPAESAQSAQPAPRAARREAQQAPSAPATAPTPTHAPPLAARPSPTTRGYLLIAIGGVAVAVGGIFLLAANIDGFEYGAYAIDAFVVGGLLLAIGWGIRLQRGEAGPMPVIGGAVLLVGWISGALVAESDDLLGSVIAGIIGNASLALCAFTHVEALELEAMESARLAAMVAAGGFVIATVAASRQFPDIVQLGGVWIGMIGTFLFGLALAYSAGQRALSPAGATV